MEHGSTASESEAFPVFVVVSAPLGDSGKLQLSSQKGSLSLAPMPLRITNAGSPAEARLSFVLMQRTAAIPPSLAVRVGHADSPSTSQRHTC